MAALHQADEDPVHYLLLSYYYFCDFVANLIESGDSVLKVCFGWHNLILM